MSRGDDFDAQAYAQERADFHRWKEQQRDDAEDGRSSDQTEALSLLFLFLADGVDTRTLEARSLALLYVLRPDLLGGATRAAIAKTIGLTASGFDRYLALCREHLPIFALSRMFRHSRGRSYVDGLLSRAEVRRRRRVVAAQAHDWRRKAREAESMVRATDSIRRDIRAKWEELDAEVSRRCVVPDCADPFEAIRASILAKRGLEPGV